MVSVRQRSADFFVRYAIVDADRQGVTVPLITLIQTKYMDTWSGASSVIPVCVNRGAPC